ncbi:MAG TPA: TIM barrel protein [Phycisphaerae bacterium]|nr:TIM barrel protein [Phycisphaerae bacterium]
MNARIAVGVQDGAGRPVAEVMATARALGADGVELNAAHWSDDESPFEAWCAENVAMIREVGLGWAGLNLPDLDGGHENGRPETVSRLCEAIAAVGRCGAPAINLAFGPRNEFSIETACRCTARLLAVAATARVRLRVTNRLGSRLEQIEDVRRIVASLRHPLLGLRLDAGQFHAAAANPRDIIAEFGDLTDAIVLSDRIGRREVPIGTGRVNLAGLVADAQRAGYDGWFVVHVDPDGGGDSSTQHDPVELVRRLWSEALRQNSQ